MLDVGLLSAAAFTLAVLWCFLRVAAPPAWDTDEVFEGLWWPLFAGLTAARLANLVLDGGLWSISARTVLMVGNGVEFWPGVLAAAITATVRARAEGVEVSRRLAELACAFVVGVGAFELTCVVRGGCFGPESLIGLTPPGFSGPQVPVALLVGFAAIAAGVVLARQRALTAGSVVLAAVSVIASLRWLSWFHLPRVPGSAERIQMTNTAVLGACAALWAGRAIVHRTGRDAGTPGARTAGGER